VYNLLPSKERRAVSATATTSSISRWPATKAPARGWHDLEGEFGNKYRWMGERASAACAP